MKLTIIYDNTAWREDLEADWGFSCLVEAYDKTILFDTGANGGILLENMKKLDIDPHRIQDVVISHSHWDHTGGLSEFLRIRPVRVFVPLSCGPPAGATEVVSVDTPTMIYDHIFSTGELRHVEQSLVIQTGEEAVVVAGCSHPGVGEILRAASSVGKVKALIGGLHGFSEFGLLQDLDLVCPTHCTQYKQKIQELYPDLYLEGGAGRVIEI